MLIMVIAAVWALIPLRSQAQTAYHIGDVYTNRDGSKGIIFYLSPEGDGLMVALHDASSSCVWGPASNVLTPVTSTANFGTQPDGYTNTSVLWSNPSFQSNGYAVKKVDYDNGWFLPSAEQLSLLFASLTHIFPIFAQNGGQPPMNNYWSSTPNDDNRAWSMNFYDGKRSISDKSSSYYAVRPILHFNCLQMTQADTTITYRWSTGDTSATISVVPDTTTTYLVIATNRDGDQDSVSITVQVSPIVITDIYLDTCNNYTWHHVTYDTTGVYEYNEHSFVSGCDSFIRLHLTINYSDTTHIYHEACDEWTWNGETYDTSGIYKRFFSTIHGCDSIVYLHLTIHDSYDDEVYLNICKGQLPYVWRDTTFEDATLSQIDTFRKHSVHGCDSITILHLYVFDGNEYYDTVRSCHSYSVNDTTIYDSGDYRIKFEIPGAECDSIVNLHLTILPVSDTIPVQQEVCGGYEWNGEYYTESGNYYFNGTNQYGCDSVTKLQLTVKNDVIVVYEAEVCKGDDYVDEVHDLRVYRTDTLDLGCNEFTFACGSAANGCDSIHVLRLSVVGKNVSILNSQDSICAHQEDSVTLEVVGDNYHAIPSMCEIPEIAIGDVLCEDGRIVKLNDYVQTDNAVGIVFYVDSSAMHGWVVALQNSGSVRWAANPWNIENIEGIQDCMTIRQAVKDTGGQNNTQVIRHLEDSLGLSNSFPAFDVIGDVGMNWYLPAAGQLRCLFANIVKINESLGVLASFGVITGTFAMDSDFDYYWSSSETRSNKACVVSTIGAVSLDSSKNYPCKVRAIKSF